MTVSNVNVVGGGGLPPPPAPQERHDTLASIAFVLASIAFGALTVALLLWAALGSDVFGTGFYAVLQPFWFQLGPVALIMSTVALIRQLVVRRVSRRDRMKAAAALGMSVLGAVLTFAAIAATGGP
jgi:hypothetical protein